MDNLWIWLVVEPYPSEKYEFVNWMLTFPIYGKIKNVPNHQPGKKYHLVIKHRNGKNGNYTIYMLFSY